LIPLLFLGADILTSFRCKSFSFDWRTAAP
jgi:hypothetical protein